MQITTPSQRHAPSISRSSLPCGNDQPLPLSCDCWRLWEAKATQWSHFDFTIVRPTGVRLLSRVWLKVLEMFELGEKHTACCVPRPPSKKATWRQLGALVFFAAALAPSACTRFVEERPQAYPELDWPRWDAPDYSTRTIMDPNELSQFRIALDHTGSRMAVAVPGRPSPGLILLDLKTEKATLLTNQISTLELVEPSFARDGRQVVFLATPVPRFGWTEIWIASSEGVFERRLPDCHGMHRAPVFSPDGRQVAYFRDADRASSDAWLNVMWPEQRSRLLSHPFGIFAYDLETRAERRITGLAYSLVEFIEFMSEDSLFVSAGGLLGHTTQPDMERSLIPEDGTANVVSALDAFPNSKELWEQTTRAVLLLDVGDPEPVIASPEAIGVSRLADVELAPEGQPIVMAPIDSLRAATTPFRPFEYRYSLVRDGANELLLETTSIPSFSRSVSRTPLSLSGDLCTMAWWGTDGSQELITVTDVCTLGQQQFKTFVVDELVRKAQKIMAPWNFGDVCKRSD